MGSAAHATATVAALVAAASTLLIAGCGDDRDRDPTNVLGPPPGVGVDYQLGGAYPPPDSVEIVVRDRSEAPAAGLYSICYVNAFQTQPGELDAWPTDLILTTAGGDVLFDPGWPDEALLDTSTRDTRARIADVVGGWIDDCAADGFDAVEFDNLDHFTRSNGALDASDNLALARTLIERAHAVKLAVGQKNAAELVHEGLDAGFDFVVTESCHVFDECARYTDAYGAAVIEIEYVEDGDDVFARACADHGDEISIVQRDLALAPRGSPGYVFALCP